VKILIVEDNKSLNEVYKFILEKQGYKVSSTFNGAEGLKAAKAVEPDLILLDMLMPEMDGVTFLKKYNLSKNSKVIVLVLSNLDEDGEIKEARKLGAHDYIMKAATSPAELVAKVKELARANGSN
jgi:two-component system, OmpR family, alkaline phosphatase synthesis response regulator PhoP